MASASTNIETINTWCYCGQDETYDYMIGCNNEECSIQWFHLSCVHMTMDEVRLALSRMQWKCLIFFTM